MSALHRLVTLVALGACSVMLSGCIVGTVVGTAVDVGVEVVKVPFKVGKGIYDVMKDDEPPAKSKTVDAGNSGQKSE